ncbi:sulfatase-like hydrolase/transferase [Mangrovicoccus ximenensis]|uniref:sulfatase-like hydrolase/transferase n=1 Tax=Mangrovicoccus ximenensis TaxID=1911570 RepID=UPI000D367349|nr:sulfatase-like hydrolase/transferase [Mangrovicoccus ximenensis]
MRNATAVAAGAVCALLAGAAAAQEAEKPNILVIWGDDVGMWNISAYHRGMMCCETPNIDRIAAEGMLFMDHYAQASCTAGRAAFITGQYPLRTGLATVGLPGAPQGLSAEDPTLAEMLKPLGYRTGQFGKNHLGDQDEHLPTAHGFDEFFGILYHLNAGEYAEQADYPAEAFEEAGLAQRGIIHSFAASGGGEQQIEDLGPFGAEVQTHLDQDVLEESKRFITEAVEAGEPFFVWHNTTRTHYKTHLDDHYDGITGTGSVYADGMVEMDDDVGELLDLLDELGVAGETVVMFSTDNGAASNSWPDGGNQPFRGQKGVGGYEGGFKVPAMIRWPGLVPAGTTTGELVTMEDWVPTIMAQLGQPGLKEDLLDGAEIGGKSYRVHLDGYDQSPVLTQSGPSNRQEFFFFTETTFHGMRYGEWKFLFTQQDKWFNGVQDSLTSPLITRLDLDPFERFHDARGFDEWQENRSWALGPASAITQTFFQSFQDYPPRQASLDFDMDKIIDDMMDPGAR